MKNCRVVATYFGPRRGHGGANNNGLADAKLLVNYLYLDTDERRRFAQVSHEYLIEQVQFTGKESVCTASATVTASSNKITLNFS